ncbi:MAG: 3-oxoacyl-[acyl-carrier-protein] reductase [Lachnospirales bacterium]
MNKKNAIITGGARGIGFAIAKEFAKNNYNILINNIADVEKTVIDELNALGAEVHTFISDVSDFEQCQKLVDFAKEKMGTIDVLVNNAGITDDTLIMRMKEEQFDRVINVNLKGTFNMTRHVSSIMAKQRSGSIINIASIVGVIGNAGQSNYAASKAGVIGLTKSVARELAGRGVFCNAIAPGFIVSDMTDKLSDKQKEGILVNVPLNKLGTVEDVAKTALFLGETKYITGQVIQVDGGMGM